MRGHRGVEHVFGALLYVASCLLGQACERAAASKGPMPTAEPEPRMAVPPIEPAAVAVAEVSSASCTRAQGAELAAVDDLLAAVNAARKRGADCGARGKQAPAPALTASVALSCAARNHAYDMSTRGYFAHADPEGGRARDRARSAGYTGQVGENLAWGQSSPEQVVEVWLKSPDHCHNMLRPQLTTAGAGFARSAAGKTFWVQVYGVDAPATQ